MMTPTETLEKRLRWKSRRGLLELDLLLAQFWRQYGGHLTHDELQALDARLDLDDEELRQTLLEKQDGILTQQEQRT